jgi:hypothetical protein
MNTQELDSVRTRENRRSACRNHKFVWAQQTSNCFLIAGLVLLAYGLAWNYSTERYLKGFADAIVPLNGSPVEKVDALLKWFHHEPERSVSFVQGTMNLRDPIYIVQNARLLKYCGSATNAFINLADVAGLKTRRLLLLNETGGAKHVLAEVQSGDRWVVVDASLGFMFTDRSGRALTKEELRDPKTFKDATRRMPGYSSTYTFESTSHVHLRRLPVLGPILRRNLDDFFPGWEESINWGYFPEHPSLWPVIVAVPLILLCTFARLLLNPNSGKGRLSTKTVSRREELTEADRVPSYRSA